MFQKKSLIQKWLHYSDPVNGLGDVFHPFFKILEKRKILTKKIIFEIFLFSLIVDILTYKKTSEVTYFKKTNMSTYNCHLKRTEVIYLNRRVNKFQTVNHRF